MTDNTMARWEPLHSRGHSRKLNLFYKIRNNDRPLYLYDCLLPFIREENELNLHNQTEFRNPFTRLQLFANSLFRSTIKSWNKLSPQLRMNSYFGIICSSSDGCQ